MASPKWCECGGRRDAHDTHIRFDLPEPVLGLPDRERTPGIWMSHASPRESVMMQVDGVGAFVRVLLPIRLTAGHMLTFGLWLGVHPDDLGAAFEAWLLPEYKDLRLDGRLANRIPPWDLFGTPVVATVLDPDHTPTCTDSPDPTLRRVLTREWPHEIVHPT